MKFDFEISKLYLHFQLHIVHYNSDKYGSFAEASDKPDGLGIIAVMVNVSFHTYMYSHPFRNPCLS